MGTGVSIFLIAVGAILAFAVETDTSGFDINTAGVILMIVGAIGLLASMLFWSSYSPFGRRDQSYVVEEHTHSSQPPHVH